MKGHIKQLLHNLMLKREKMRREEEEIDKMIEKIEKMIYTQNQTTLNLDGQEINQEFVMWLAQQRHQNQVDFNEWCNQVGAKRVKEIVYEWTGIKYTFPQIKNMAREEFSKVVVQVITQKGIGGV